MHKDILNSSEFSEEMGNLIDIKKFKPQIANLILSMVYKIDDSYDNYKKIKRVVPTKGNFLNNIYDDVKSYCSVIDIIKINNENQIKMKSERLRIKSPDKYLNNPVIYTFPTEKDLLYAITKAEIDNNVNAEMSLEERAVLTTVGIGKAISRAEVLRDFNGWSWSIDKSEIESSECNIVYILLTYVLGDVLVDNLRSAEDLKINLPEPLWNELVNVSMQFYKSFDKMQNEKILDILAVYKNEYLKMRYPYEYQQEILTKKNKAFVDLQHINELLQQPNKLKNEFMLVNSKLPSDKKIFDIRNYQKLLINSKANLEKQINEYSKIQDPMGFEKMKEELMLKIKYYEVSTNISKFEKQFLEVFEKQVIDASDKKGILDLIYQTRYLNNIPNCKMKLNRIQEKLIPKAIEYEIINPISNNDDLDYRILRGIFDSKELNLEDLSVKLKTVPEVEGIIVEIYNSTEMESTYIANTPEGSEIEIKTSRKTKIFSK